MTNFDLLDQIPMHYIFGTGIVILILVLYALAKVMPREVGLVPTAFAGLNRFGDWLFGEAMLLYGFLFGTKVTPLDEFFANEITLKRLSKTITVLSSALVIASFLASFRASRAFMIYAGIDPDIAWTLPTVVDAFIILCLLYIAYHSYKNQNAGWGRAALFIFTGLSVFFNVSHLIFETNVNLGSSQVVVGSLAPLSIFVAAEFMSTVLRSQTYREGFMIADHELQIKYQETQNKLAEAQMKVDAHKGIIAGIDQTMKEYREREASLTESIAYMENVLERLDQQFVNGVPNGFNRLDQVRTLMNQGLDHMEIADTLNVKPDTAKSYVRSVQNGKA